MRPLVFGQRPCFGETFATSVASEWFLALVTPHVGVERIFLIERLGAKVTRPELAVFSLVALLMKAFLTGGCESPVRLHVSHAQSVMSSEKQLSQTFLSMPFLSQVTALSANFCSVWYLAHS